MKKYMKKGLVFIAGFSPFLIGHFLNQIIMNSNYASTAFYYITSGLFLMYWGLLGFLLCNSTTSKIRTTIICNFPAFGVLLLIIFQELINKGYWSNFWGLATQYFYIPTLKISFDIAPYLHYMWESCITSFILMSIVFYAGCYIRSRVHFKRANN